jgi:hypothetical protein
MDQMYNCRNYIDNIHSKIISRFIIKVAIIIKIIILILFYTIILFKVQSFV